MESFSEKTFWVLVLLSFLIFLLCPLNLWHRAALPFPVAVETGTGAPFFLSGRGERQHIQAVEGIPAENAEIPQMVADNHRVGEIITLQTRENGLVQIRLTRFYTIENILLFLFIGLCFVIIGIWVRSRSRDLTANYFVTGSFLFGFIIAMNWPGVAAPIPGWILLAIFAFSYPLAFITLFLFSYYFPRQRVRPEFIRRAKTILLTLSLSLSAGLLAVSYFRFEQPSIAAFRVYQTFYRIFRFFLMALVLGALFNMIRNGWRTADRVNRLKLYWLVGGVAVGSFPFLFLWNLPYMLNLTPMVPETLASLALLFIPVSIAIAIVKYRLFDIEFFLSRGIVYTVTIGLLLSIYVGIAGASSFILTKNFNLKSPFLSAISAVVIALLFAPVRDRIEAVVDKHFFHIRGDRFDALQKFMNGLNECRSSEEALRHLCASVDQFFPLERNQCVYCSDGKQCEVLGAKRRQEGFRWFPAPATAGRGQIYLNSKRLSLWEEKPKSFAVTELPQDYAALIYLGEGWYWLLGEKKSGDRFWREDMQFMEELSKAVSLTLEKFSLLERAMRETAEREAAAHLSEWKSLLVSEVAHNFRSPLNTITWKLQSLAAGGREKESGIPEKTEALQLQVNRLQNMVHSLLDLSALENGKLTVSYRKIALFPLLEKVISGLQAMIVEKDLTVKLKAGKSLSLWTDEILSQEILQNLMENAIKFSPKGSCITVAGKKIWKNGTEMIEINICDPGPGIPESQLKHLFEPFSGKVSNDTGRTGLHLGLYMSRQFVRAVGGNLEVRTLKRGGTCARLLFRSPETANSPEQAAKGRRKL